MSLLLKITILTIKIVSEPKTGRLTQLLVVRSMHINASSEKKNNICEFTFPPVYFVEDNYLEFEKFLQSNQLTRHLRVNPKNLSLEAEHLDREPGRPFYPFQNQY